MKRRTLLLVLLTSLIALLLFFSVPGYAQGNLGAVTGTVQDTTGAVVPDAAITITNIDTGVKWTAKTSSAGYYRAPVPPGTYKVQAEKAGFKVAVADQVIVPVAQVVTVDLKLQPGSIKETVIVTAEAPLLQTSSAEVGSSVTPEEFASLPVEIGDGGRDLQTFIFSSLPGTVGSSWSGSINGGQLFSHEIMIDGVSIGRYDLSGGGLTETQPGTDAIAEFKVQSSNYSAEYGDTGGGVANFTYKSGTNQFHGSAFEYVKNPIFNAAGELANVYHTAKDNTKDNDFGFTFGGPIFKDRTFFFFSYEGYRFRDFSYSGALTIPTPAMITGDFSGMLGSQQLQTCDSTGANPGGQGNNLPCFDALNRPVYEYQVYDPLTTRNVTAGHVDPVTGLTATASAVIRDPFTSNGKAGVIPAAEFSTASATLLPMFPAPLFSAQQSLQNGTIKNTPEFNGCCPTLTRDAYTVKIDHVLTGKQKIWGSFNYNWRSRFQRGANTFPPFPGWPINPVKQQDVGGPQVRLAHAWNITDRSLNEFQVGYNRFQNRNGLSNDVKYFPSSIVGVPDTCFPGINLSSRYIQGIPKQLGHSCANIDPMESFILQDYFSYLRGKHSLKFGAEYRKYRYNTFEPDTVSGGFNFLGDSTGLPGFFTVTGNPYASFIVGAVNNGNRQIYPSSPHYRSGLYAFFAQDDFKATSKLTLNLGLRWEIAMPQTEINNHESGFSGTLLNAGADNIGGALEFLGSCSTCNGRHSLENWYFKDFAPRIGVAYGITNKLVFRGGYGISFAPPIEDNFGTLDYLGFTDYVNAHAGSSPTGFVNDPAIYWSPLASATPPGTIGLRPYTGTLPDLDPTLANGNSVDFLPRNGTREPYTQNWSAGFQYMLPRDLLLQADYMGSKGTRLLNGYFGGLLNQPQTKYMGLGDMLLDDLQTDLQNPTTAAILAGYGITGLPYPDFEANNWESLVQAAIQPYPQITGLMNNYPTMGSSTYHSLQLMARKNTKHGLMFIAAYTYSKLLTDSDAALYASGSENVQDIWNRQSEKGIASYDYTHVLKLTWVYDLPFGRGQRWLNSGGVLDRLAGGWQLSAIQNYTSGDPLTIYSIDGSGFVSSWGIRGDIVPGVSPKVPSGPLDPINGTPYLNPAAFVDPPASPVNGFALRYGNSPPFLTNVRGPVQMGGGESFGIVKNTRLSERFNLQFRADMFNVFNRQRLGDPDTSLGDGLPNFVNGANQGGTFSLVTGPQNGPRLIQFALHLTF